MNATSVTASMWLVMAHHGGLWTPSEIAREINLDPAQAHRVAQNLADSGAARKHPATEQHTIRYSVSIDCGVPRGVTLDDILACNLQVLEDA